MTENEILHQFLLSRGFSNVRSSGQVLDAAAIYHNTTFAFKIAHCNRRVYSVEHHKFTLIGQNHLASCCEFAERTGYGVFVIVCFHTNSILSLTEIKYNHIKDWSNFVIKPRSYWRYKELLDQIVFYQEYAENIKIKKKRVADLLKICNGMRYKTSGGEQMSIECIFREECKRYVSWKRYDKAKREGRLHRLYYARDLRYIHPLVESYNDWSCPDFKKKIKLQTKIEQRDGRKRNR